jgi:hypothetical protein
MQAFIVTPSSPSTQPQQPTSLVDRLKQQLLEWGNCLVHDLTTTQEAVQIRTRERNGVVTWFVYDRLTGQRQQLASEADVHRWLEQRYAG